MKLISIIILLLSVNAHASLRLQITPTDSKYASMQLNGDTQEQLDKKLLKWIKRQRFFKGEWNTTQENSIISKTTEDIDGQEITQYFHPSNFSVQLTDRTQEIADEQAAQLAEKTERQALKQMKQNINDSNLPSWHKRILKMYIKSLSDD